jgi:hypothetical protein
MTAQYCHITVTKDRLPVMWNISLPLAATNIYICNDNKQFFIKKFGF